MKRLSLLSGITGRKSSAPVLLLGLAVVVLTVAGCTVSAAQQSSAQSVAPTATAPAAEVGAGTLLLGTYANPSAHGGPGILSLADGGQYAQDVTETSSVLVVVGTWKVTGDQIEFTENPGGDCPGVQGTYKWASDGKVLRLWLVEDTCTPRAGDFVSGPWTKQP